MRNDLNDIEYLQAEGIIKTYTTTSLIQPKNENEKMLFDDSKSLYRSLAEMYGKLEKSDPDFDIKLQAYASAMSDVETKTGLIHLLQDGIENVHPVYNLKFPGTNSIKKDQVLQFVLKQFPVPDDGVSWERIQEYRADEELKHSYGALVVWINDLAHSTKTISEIDEEFNQYYRSFSKAYEKHKVKTKFISLMMLLSITATITQGGTTAAALAIPTIITYAEKLSDWCKELLGTKLEGFDLPGNQVAYIFHTRNKFED